MTTTSRGAFMRVWGAPTVLALASTVGLVSALVGDGVWDAVSWGALGAPCAAVTWAWARSRR